MSVVAILGYRFLDHGIRTRQFNHRSKQRLKTVDLIIKHGQRRNGDWPWPLGPPTFSQILGTCVDNHSIFGYWRSYFVYVKKRHSSFDGDFNNPVGWLVFFLVGAQWTQTWRDSNMICTLFLFGNLQCWNPHSHGALPYHAESGNLYGSGGSYRPWTWIAPRSFLGIKSSEQPDTRLQFG